MSKFKGTPGPWIVDGTVIRGDADHIGRTVSVACTLNVAWPYGRRAIKEQPYNARLIAAAPELLEALIMCCQSMSSVLPDFNPFDQAAYDKARAAIAKATGEAP